MTGSVDDMSDYVTAIKSHKVRVGEKAQTLQARSVSDLAHNRHILNPNLVGYNPLDWSRKNIIATAQSGKRYG